MSHSHTHPTTSTACPPSSRLTSTTNGRLSRGQGIVTSRACSCAIAPLPRSARSYYSQPTPSPSLSKRCGSGGRTVKRRYGMSPQSRSGGGGGMQTVGYDGSQFAGGGEGLGAGAGGDGDGAALGEGD